MHIWIVAHAGCLRALPDLRCLQNKTTSSRTHPEGRFLTWDACRSKMKEKKRKKKEKLCL